MNNRPRPGRFIDAVRVAVTVGRGHSRDSAASAVGLGATFFDRSRRMIGGGLEFGLLHLGGSLRSGGERLVQLASRSDAHSGK